eukprot:XP_001611316.1 regulator of nonsense transcripts [Babesia bovis T2Bo]
MAGKRAAVKRGGILPQRKRLSTGIDSEQSAIDDKESNERLLELSKQFGAKPEFNRHIYDDDHVMMTYRVLLRDSRYKVDLDVDMEGTHAVGRYTFSKDGSEVTSGVVVSTNKKSAQRSAARRILAHVDAPNTDQLMEITKWIVSSHKRITGVKESVLSDEFGPSGHVVTMKWTIADKEFVGQGTSNSLTLAGMYASQELYCLTLHLATTSAVAALSSMKKPMSGDLKAITEPNATNNHETVPKAPSALMKSSELSKEDAAQMITIRSSIANRMKITQEESGKAVPGGFEWTLLWQWEGTDKTVEKKVTKGYGLSKTAAKAAASKAMLVDIGFIDEITAEESAEASSIRNVIPKNLGEAVKKAVPFIARTNCSVWRLFLPQLMDAIVYQCDNSLMKPILDVIVKADLELPSDIWDSLLYSAYSAIDETFCRTILHGIKNLKLDPNYFLSPKAQAYYQKQSWLLALEFNAENCANITSLESRSGKDVVSIVGNLVRTQLPLLFLQGESTAEYLKNSLKEDDLVLLVPRDTTYQWGRGILCILTKHKNENQSINITCKVIRNLNPETSDSIYSEATFGVFHVNSSITNKRMMQALMSITHRMMPLNSSNTPYYYDKELLKLIVEREPQSVKEVDCSNLPLSTRIPLTDTQAAACRYALSHPLTLIQGPPGTGKTQVACAIIDCLIRKTSEKILAVADSNVAADNLIEGLDRRGIQALRVGFGSESLLQEESLKRCTRYGRYRYLRESGMHKEANSMRVLMILDAIKTHQVIIATCVGSGNDVLAGYSFPYVIIDECAQSIEPSNLIPIGKGCRQLVLIGDHMQLRPTIISTEAASEGLSSSLLENLVNANVGKVHLLDVQRRMHPSISEFPNNQFYKGLITDAIEENSRNPIKGFEWPSPAYNIAFIDASSGGPNGQFESVVGTSRSNALEVEIILMLLKSFLDAGDVRESDIGILTAYDAQKWQLRRKVNQMFGINAQAIEIDSVDGFQGKEKELILFSGVRSNNHKDIGFLKDPRRMNVMLTRARRGLIVVADKFTIMNDISNWRRYMDYITDRVLDIHISQLNKHLHTPSPQLESIVSRAKTGKYP